ncbi:F-box only protein 6-like isoform X3 [Oncorhynchus keta]|uniref:F-box only protein 6-like isoform X3 n=3 Tax=Oncorhynchus keta TaxID=8018 RepID=UPI00227D402A|nr:F-box only protein 6-like isoform X3 [Oncorhynchus keta]
MKWIHCCYRSHYSSSPTVSLYLFPSSPTTPRGGLCDVACVSVKDLSQDRMSRKRRSNHVCQLVCTEAARWWTEHNLFTGMLPVLPLDVLEEMLLNVPPQQVVCVCRLVCREWKEVVDSDSLWRERCRREGYQTYVTKLPKDWRLFYFLCKKRRNLLKNPRADDKFKGWQIMENGGDKWKIESVEEVPLPDNTVQKYFATSYSTCRKSQLIDLEKEGYRPSFMDDFQPDIIISDWYAPRWDCGSEYEICVELLNRKKKPIKKFSPDTVVFQQWNDQKWNQMTHVFKNYGPGVRYIRFIHGGNDTQFWAGWYGIRVTNSSIEICPSVDR